VRQWLAAAIFKPLAALMQREEQAPLVAAQQPAAATVAKPSMFGTPFGKSTTATASDPAADDVVWHAGRERHQAGWHVAVWQHCEQDDDADHAQDAASPLRQHRVAVQQSAPVGERAERQRLRRLVRRRFRLASRPPARLDSARPPRRRRRRRASRSFRRRFRQRRRRRRCLAPLVRAQSTR
jgi:hypothetical protein